MRLLRMDEFLIPIYYMTRAGLADPEVQRVLDALSLHPPQACIFHDIYDADLALKLAPERIGATSFDDARSLAVLLSQENVVTIVIGDAHLLDAVYEDNSRSAVLYG